MSFQETTVENTAAQAPEERDINPDTLEKKGATKEEVAELKGDIRVVIYVLLIGLPPQEQERLWRASKTKSRHASSVGKSFLRLWVPYRSSRFIPLSYSKGIHVWLCTPF